MRTPSLIYRRADRPCGSTLQVLVTALVVSAALDANAQAIDRARDLVNPFIGTGGHGHTFPGACVPNGLVQLSPDTRPDGMMDWDGCGGYHYSDSIIYGFSHTHLSGTGVADLCDVLITPVAGSGGMAFDGSATRSLFSHASEEASAGYYKVDLLGPPHSGADGSSVQAARPTRLAGSSIRAELTATARVGVHRYQFPKGQAARIVLNLSHRDKLRGSEIRQISPTEVVGERRSSSWASDQHLFFCIRFSKPIQEEDIFPSNLATGLLAGYQFGPLEEPLVVKVGISAVSVEGARANLDAEVAGWDFDAVRKQAEDKWNAKLGKIEVTGGTREQQRIFYSALYHTYVAPYIFNDVDGNYRGMDGQVHHADHNVYTVFSLWDTFRGLHPLMTILEPDMTADWIKTFLLHYQQGGRLPVWELWGNETDCMIGYHSVSVITDAYQKGIRGFDVQLAREAMQKGAMRDEPGLQAYRTKSFISSEDQSESVSKTLEYAYDDACIARFSAYSSPTPWRDDTIRYFFKRAESFANLYDPSTGFFRARRNGGFVAGFDPFEVNFNFTEANAWQYSLFVPQDVDKLIELHGGKAGLEAHLDQLFTAKSKTSGREQADITGLIGQYAHGNEPSHHMAYLYNRVDKPEKTRIMVKRIMDEMYHDAPDGLSGNEDCGQMSAWYVLSALGFYPISPGINERYELGYPLFDEATIHMPGRDRSMVMTTTVPFDTILSSYWIDHSELIRGGEIAFREDRSAFQLYWRDPRVLDGAYVKENKQPCSTPSRPGAPLIQAAAAAFSDSLEVTVTGCGSCMVEEAGATRTCSVGKPFVIHNTATVSVAWNEDYSPVIAHYTKTDGSRIITLGSTYANEYAGGGDRALVDGLRGGPDFRTGEWQGYHDQDVLATIDLGRVRKLNHAGVGMLQDQNSWIFYPEYVDIAWSMNGRQWSSTKLVPGVDRRAEGGLNMDLWSGTIGKKARFIKVMAKNGGPCPEWHKGKGGATWIFLDELLLDVE
ncbi:MAG: GH92 family glycosyl hydrolase [Flavobacteriales bacterium]|nr:GH92 family glycosyl hydrolase [Flavobacteriales bacterium]